MILGFVFSSFYAIHHKSPIAVLSTIAAYSGEKEQMMNDSPNRLECDISGNKIVYYSQGKGEPIVLIHGITTYSFIWQKIVPLLIKKYNVISLDLPGCGDSDKPLNTDYSIKNHAMLFNEFVTKIGLEKFHMVGHDLGGGITQIFAVRYPDRLFDLALINSVAYDFWPVQPISALATPILGQLLLASLDFGTFKMIVKRGLFHKERVTPKLMNSFWRPLNTQSGRKAFIHFAKSLDNQDLVKITNQLKKIKLPTLIIRGEKDAYLGPELSTWLHRTIPKSKFVNVPTGGHFIQEDEPEIIADNLIRFYQENKDET
ncbi:MAG: alpha/beta hydrolase [Desulfobacteraceae bacterium]|nr:alpha/beta hydrolase [Desulfobacteraceae bacterium]